MWISSLTVFFFVVVGVAHGRSYHECQRCWDEFVNPVCGNDNRLYKSQCHIEQANCYSSGESEVAAVPWSECNADCQRAICTLEYQEVCDEFGVLHYGNTCTFLWESCGKATPLKQGPMERCDTSKSNSNYVIPGRL